MDVKRIEQQQVVCVRKGYFIYERDDHSSKVKKDTVVKVLVVSWFQCEKLLMRQITAGSLIKYKQQIWTEKWTLADWYVFLKWYGFEHITSLDYKNSQRLGFFSLKARTYRLWGERLLTHHAHRTDSYTLYCVVSWSPPQIQEQFKDTFSLKAHIWWPQY